MKIIGTKSSHTSIAGLEIPVSGNLEEIEEADAVIFSSGRGTATDKGSRILVPNKI